MHRCDAHRISPRFQPIPLRAERRRDSFGRLFYHAHHVVDVVFGACITAAAHFALGAAGIEPASTLWWTPVAAEAAALPMMKLLSTWENKEH